MTDSVDERGVHTYDDCTQARGKVAIPVKSDIGGDRVVELELGSPVTAILGFIAAERGCVAEELVLAREGADEPLTSGVVIDEDYPYKRRHHVHRPGEVTVRVFYQADQHCRVFKRFEAVKDVLAWAIQVFNVDVDLATEFELARHGQKEELPGFEHIGHLAGKDCELALDLVRGDIANGSWS